MTTLCFCCGKTTTSTSPDMAIVNLSTRTALYHTAQYLSGQLQLYNVLATRQIFRLMLKKHRNHSADAGPSWVCPALPPPWLPALPSQGSHQISIPIVSLGPPVLFFLPSFLTHGFPGPSLHRPKQKKTGSLFVFGLVILQTRALICPFVSFAARCFDRGSSSSLTLSLPVSYRHFYQDRTKEAAVS
ncbi:hypothetical protein M431DRAFT_512031 [Trichoderma harzianum CBS 226.95]|uniref:Uncharacterized protein n=1 Tax=Trichoderma harzianum CBS 226.95 TaxID=983964 RepID=A0A2T4A080_TRIHA|nr:hypothetical protein M431DRAFT_512031 [Trichoderma harzianum CBS 226.95]PTB50466.1 hypothetical protein M431DRAFT_512031 [Trichoderma harzianum CBS 226.95]